MRYNEITLTKEMYDVPNKTLSDILTEIDLNSGYDEFDEIRELDAFERQLKRFDIKVKGVKSDQVNKFFQSEKSLILFPEYIRRMIKRGINDASIIPYISATEVYLPDVGKRYSYSLGVDNTYQMLLQIADLTNFTKEFECCCHAARQLNIETFGIILKNIGIAIAQEINNRCVTYIKNRVYHSPLLIKKITIDNLFNFINSVGTNITTIICDPKTYDTIITFPETINHINLSRNDVVNAPFGITMIKSNALTNEIIGIDKTSGLETLYDSKDVVNSDELISADFDKISYSIKMGFNQIVDGSFARAIIEEE